MKQGNKREKREEDLEERIETTYERKGIKENKRGNNREKKVKIMTKE